MKFARYLRDNQIPEWKKAYIDYRGLKKQITAIRRARQQFRPLEGQEELGSYSQRGLDQPVENDSPRRPSDVACISSSSRRDPDAYPPTKRTLFQTPLPSIDAASDSPTSGAKPETSNKPTRKSSGPGRMPSHARSMSTLRRRRNSQTAGSARSFKPFVALPLHELPAQLSPEEKKLFDMLDAELDRIESFYLMRERETQERSNLLKGQLNELSGHKKVVQAAHPKTPGSWYGNLFAKSRPRIRIYPTICGRSNQPPELEAKSVNTGPSIHLEQFSSEDKAEEKEAVGSGDEHNLKQDIGNSDQLSSDPEDYHHAKKTLKKAFLEHYRELEALHNYRILNITGFRKTLKKFEKVTKIPAQQYMVERVEKSAFASNKSVSTMIMEVQDFYATVFSRGDRKRAMRRLHAGILVKNHHFSTFRSGLFIGLALPALVDGVYHSFQQRTRDAIPGWDGLLFVYGVILIPVLFSLLIGINLLVWAQSRINYVFIFELDTRTRLDYRQYYETPSVILAGLCYAFWLSFQQIGAPSVSPTVWPLVWLGFTFLLMINPLPFLSKPSRYWLFKHVGKLLVPGTRRVEFTDFWLGDQFCSLIFTLSNMYVFCCVYANGFDSNWRKCASSSPRWPVPFVLTALPLIIRVVQSIRRYVDSKLITHLINGGKYASGIVSYLLYYIWRHQGGRGTSFALWCVFNTVYSIYASSWDILMDWSVARPHAHHPFLRDEIIYSNSIPLYYVAIILNILIRFIWVLYIPQKGPNIILRTFIVAMLEVFRRWQWNFYRLENEHLGNMDQYRVTREVPLPYSFEDSYSKDDTDDEDISDVPGVSPGPALP